MQRLPEEQQLAVSLVLVEGLSYQRSRRRPGDSGGNPHQPAVARPRSTGRPAWRIAGVLMSAASGWDDERIHAFVDGELDASQAAQLERDAFTTRRWLHVSRNSAHCARDCARRSIRARRVHSAAASGCAGRDGQVDTVTPIGVPGCSARCARAQPGQCGSGERLPRRWCWASSPDRGWPGLQPNCRLQRAKDSSSQPAAWNRPCLQRLGDARKSTWCK